MDAKKYTIKDVAQLAGVSKGTVDRVLHNRGKVSVKALEKVNQVLKELDFKPNPFARNLKQNKIYKICVLLPDSNKDSYWAPARNGIKQASKEFKPFGVLVEEYAYHPFKESSFVEKSKEALASKPDVILMASQFYDESIALFRICKEQNVLMALFNNNIDSIDGELFIGQDLSQCGRIGADLMNKMVGQKSILAVIHINKEPHMQIKQNGFEEYFADSPSKEQTIISKCFNLDTEQDFSEEVAYFLKSNPNISAFFVTNSKAYLLVNEMEKLSYKSMVVGFDLLDKNIAYLKQGKIAFLIHQKPRRQAYLGIGFLADHFLFGKDIPSQKLLPIDIITSENMKYHVK